MPGHRQTGNIAKRGLAETCWGWAASEKREPLSLDENAHVSAPVLGSHIPSDGCLFRVRRDFSVFGLQLEL